MQELLKLAIENDDIAKMLCDELTMGYCPSDFNMKDLDNCKYTMGSNCKKCWKKALKEV